MVSKEVSDICVLLHYLLKEKEVLNAVHWYAISIQQAVDFETQFPLGFRLWLFGGEAAEKRDRKGCWATIGYKREIHNVKPPC